MAVQQSREDAGRRAVLCVPFDNALDSAGQFNLAASVLMVGCLARLAIVTTRNCHPTQPFRGYSRRRVASSLRRSN
jgi:hypothetical protein